MTKQKPQQVEKFLTGLPDIIKQIRILQYTDNRTADINRMNACEANRLMKGKKFTGRFVDDNDFLQLLIDAGFRFPALHKPDYIELLDKEISKWLTWRYVAVSRCKMLEKMSWENRRFITERVSDSAKKKKAFMAVASLLIELGIKSSTGK